VFLQHPRDPVQERLVEGLVAPKWPQKRNREAALVVLTSRPHLSCAGAQCGLCTAITPTFERPLVA
jgi:hypothetical protein